MHSSIYFRTLLKVFLYYGGKFSEFYLCGVKWIFLKQILILFCISLLLFYLVIISLRTSVHPDFVFLDLLVVFTRKLGSITLLYFFQFFSSSYFYFLCFLFFFYIFIFLSFFHLFVSLSFSFFLSVFLTCFLFQFG